MAKLDDIFILARAEVLEIIEQRTIEKMQKEDSHVQKGADRGSGYSEFSF